MKSPLKIERLDSKNIQITWTNKEVQKLSSELLRNNCPCAGCKELRGESQHSKPLSPKRSSLRVLDSSLEQELAIEQLWPVGNYALGIRFADGHDSGIFNFELLKKLGS